MQNHTKESLLKDRIFNSIATSIYSHPDKVGFQGYDDATEKVYKLVMTYVEKELEKVNKIL